MYNFSRIHAQKQYYISVIFSRKIFSNKICFFRDLKLENICLDQNGLPKIIDFGLSKNNLPIGSNTTTFCGTYTSLPPEMILGPHYDHSLDFWQLGVCIYLMKYQKLPFMCEDDDELAELICFKDPEYKCEYDYINCIIKGISFKI